MANTKNLEKTERKAAKRKSRSAAPALGERDYPRGSKKQKLNKLVRGQSKR
ncbi:MAG: hypothetical protein PW792_02135 [Acidobacteriaceae bacterium]|nr:hypothetical protein [Acidobacteriaceae bacterium]